MRSQRLEAFQDLQRQAHPSCEAAAVGIRAQVLLGRKELVEQKAVCSVRFKTIEASRQADLGSKAELVEQVINIFQAEVDGLGFLAAPAGEELDGSQGAALVDAFHQGREALDRIIFSEQHTVSGFDNHQGYTAAGMTSIPFPASGLVDAAVDDHGRHDDAVVKGFTFDL